MIQIQAGIVEAMVKRVMRIAILPGGDRGRNFVQSFGIEAQDLAHFPPRHAIAVGNDVGGHGGAAFAIAFVQILNDALALVAAGQVEIDVRPLAALFGQKAFEEQFHADGIDRGDAQRIADGAVGGGAASLDQNIFLAAEADQIPDNQKIAGQLEFFDQRQLTLNLAPGAALQAGIRTSVALLKTFPGPLPQKRHHGLAFRHGISGEFVPQGFEREFEPGGQFHRVGQSLRQVGEKLPHLLRRFQMTLGVTRQQTSGSDQRFVIANGGEDIAEFALLRRRIADAIGGQQRELERAGNFYGGAIACFLLAMKMALQFHIDIVAAKDAGQAIHRAPRLFHATTSQRGGEWAVIASGQADQPGSMFLQLIFANRAFAFLGPQLHFCDQAAEVLVAGARRDEKGKAESRDCRIAEFTDFRI